MDKHVPNRKIKKAVLITITAMVILAVAVFVILYMQNRLPEHIEWQEKMLDTRDGIHLILQNKEVGIYRKDVLCEKIGGKVRVQDMLVTDLEGDGNDELLLLTWRQGKYGSAKPFWEKENPKEWSQHIFIYDLNADGSISEKWFSSDNGMEVVRFKTMEKNPQILLMEDTNGECTLWRWESWGLKNMENGVRIVAFGDNLIHDTIYEYADRIFDGTYDFLYDDVRKEIREADLAALQLESILVDDPAAVSSYPYFGTPLAVGDAIVNAGFDIVSCAGNHAADKGITGIDTTTDFFAEKGVTCLGIQNSADTEYRPCEYISKNGIRFALFDYTYGTTLSIWEKYPHAVHYLDEEQIREDIASCEADCKIVFVHWGKEYISEPDEEQLKYAELFTELGVDVVIGTHPHVIQPVMPMPDANGHSTLVAFSLGNFRAYQAFDDRTMRGGKLAFTVEHCWDGVRILDWSLEEFHIPEYH